MCNFVLLFLLKFMSLTALNELLPIIKYFHRIWRLIQHFKKKAKKSEMVAWFNKILN